jgi:hypothetical protein
MTLSPYAAEDAGALHPDTRALFSNAWPRYASLALSAWLFVSAFAWPHSRDACGAAWIMGACMGMSAFAAIWASPARYFNVVLGAISLAWQAAAAEHQPLAFANGVIVSGLVILFALIPSRYPAGT